MPASLYHRDVYFPAIRRMYLESGYSLRKIAGILHTDYGVRISHCAVARMLRHHGISTSKHISCHRTAVCASCGVVFSLPRHKYRSHEGNPGSPSGVHRPWRYFHNWACRRFWLEEHSSYQDAAKRFVENILGNPLPPGAVVHFIDDDFHNLLRQNLRVFTSTDRHLQEHRKEEG